MVFLLSWNVAGWSSTSQAIRESFGSIADFFACTEADIICLQECKGTLAKLSASPVDMGASDVPLNRRPAVAPLMRLAAARAKATTGGAAGKGSRSGGGGSGGSNDGVDGWESFWSFSGRQHRGFNGVVTFARKGLTWRCDNQPFAQDDLNDEGRAVVTHHSAFVLVNVYVPNARGGARHAFKFRFLHALEAKMEQLRSETGKPVVLVGDLNMTYRAYDAAWSLRRIHLGTLLELQARAATVSDAAWAETCPQLPKAALQRVSNMITNHLCAQAQELADSLDRGGTRELDSAPSTLTAASSASPPSSPTSLPATTAGASVVSVDAEVVVDGDGIDRDALQRLCATLAQTSKGSGRGGPNYDTPPVPLQALYDVGFRCAYASEHVKSFACTQNNELYAVVHYCGLAPHADASAEFMSRLLRLPLPVSTAPMPQRLPWSSSTVVVPSVAPQQPGASAARMFDSFLLTEGIVRACTSAQATTAAEQERLLLREVHHPQLHPYCPCPHTCWDQSRNRRLENEGTRLDYILVDAALLPAVVCRAETANNTVLPGHPCEQRGADDFYGEVQGARYRDGVARTMAGGAYPPAPFDGTGMPALSETARELCCRGLPSTGLFVTPPQFSDHIGVGLVLDLTALGAASAQLQPRPGKVAEDHKCMYRPPVGLHTFFAAAAVKKPAAPQSATPVERPNMPTVEKAPGTDAVSVAGCKRGPPLDSPGSCPAATAARMEGSAKGSAAVADAHLDQCVIDVDEL